MLTEELQGKIRLSRTQSNQEDDFFTLRLTDTKSGLEVIEAKIPMSEMGNLIAGMTTEGTYWLNRNPDIGTRRERENHKAYIPNAFQGKLNDRSNWEAFYDLVALSLQNDGKGWQIADVKREPKGSGYKPRRLGEDDIGPFYTFTIQRFV